MKYILHKSDERGYSEYGGWLKSWFSFSFADWYNPEKMGFGALRVINDDIIAVQSGFGMHHHSNMEIVSIPISGRLSHKDTLGNETDINAGEVQRMSAGTGILHSEHNTHKNEDYVGFQIWVMPRFYNIKPSYEQKKINEIEKKGNLRLIVSPDGRNGSVSINQDAWFSMLELKKGEKTQYMRFNPKNIVYIMVISGNCRVTEIILSNKDAIGVLEGDIKIHSENEGCSILIIEVPEI